ncbi:peptidoglycan DD-metalloendopeptidase family protein [Sulfurospirillum sp. 1612]|uniref:peptidoglycan DD-metalloendopeptidase family protein n=1 Tax=Sulfurospirillum sp. 1612 TaxID=3094835 RepID=UPI002F91E1B4
MRRLVCLVLFISSCLNAAYLEESVWKNGETFLDFLSKNSLPSSIYYDLDGKDKELATEIIAGTKFQILRDDNDKIEQVLIPVGEEIELHIEKSADKYILTTTPIAYQTKEETLTIDIKTSPYQDIIDATHNYLLAHEFIQSYKKSVNFKYLRKGDKLVILYTKKIRLGQQFGSPTIEASMVEVRGERHYVFLYNKNRYYDAHGREVEGFFLSLPVHYTRISDRFTYKRWHPILHRYRAHLGIDYAAPRGTPVKAARAGRIIFAGRKGGYGNTIIIAHEGGYKTLYGHLKKFKRGIKRGKHVKKGQVVAYVGSTGLSTGPHLHFGLYRGSLAINPDSAIKLVKSVLSGKKKEDFLKYTAKVKENINLALTSHKEPPKEKKFDYIVRLQMKDKFVE